MPKASLLAESPRLERIFGPLVICIRKGDLTGFDKALAHGEPEFVKRRIFLTLERSRDIALRNLLRKVYLAGGYDDLKDGQTEKDRIRKSRIPLVNFAAALRMGGQAVEDDEVECLLANQIYKVRRQSCQNSEANNVTGSHERLHFARAPNGSAEQEGRLSWHRGVRPKASVDNDQTSYNNAQTSPKSAG